MHFVSGGHLHFLLIFPYFWRWPVFSCGRKQLLNACEHKSQLKRDLKSISFYKNILFHFFWKYNIICGCLVVCCSFKSRTSVLLQHGIVTCTVYLSHNESSHIWFMCMDSSGLLASGWTTMSSHQTQLSFSPMSLHNLPVLPQIHLSVKGNKLSWSWRWHLTFK